MRNLKVRTKDGTTKVVKLPKDGFGKGTQAWYMREVKTSADLKASVLASGGTLIGKRQKEKP